MMSSVIDAERAVLGSIIQKPEALPIIQETLASECSDWFREPKHNAVYNTCVSMRNQGFPIDVVTLHDELQCVPEYDMIQDAGGVAFLAELSGAVPSTANASHYAEVVADAHRLRRLEILTRQANEMSQNGVRSEDVADFVSKGQEAIFENRPKRYTPDNVASMFTDEPEPMQYLFDAIVPLNTLAGCDAAGSSGKGYLIQQLGLSLCIGRTLFPSFPVYGPRNVLWFQNEEPKEEIHRRMKRICSRYHLSEDEEAAASERLTLYSQNAEPLNQKDKNGSTVPTQYFNWIRDEVRRVQPGLIIFDPRSHFFAGEENSNTDVAAFMNLLASLTDEVDEGCTVWVNHHSSKAAQASNSSSMGRGASAGRDAMRSLFNLTPLTEKEVKVAGIDNPRLYAKLELSKCNWTAPTDGAVYLRRGSDTWRGTRRSGL